MDKRIKILLIDDDEEDYLITKDIISEFPNKNYKLDWCNDYDKAFEQTLQNKHDIYLVDYRLGIRTGVDLIESAFQAGVQAPFIILTGLGDFEIDERAQKAGAVDYIDKSKISPSQLERSIRYGLQHFKNLKKIQQLNEELEERVAERTKALAAANKQLAKVNAALRSSQKLYEEIAHHFPDGFINVFNRNFEFVFVDGEDLRYFRIDSERLIGKNFLRLAEKKNRAKIKKNFEKAFTGKPAVFEVFVDKFKRTYLVNAVPLPDSDGSIEMILVVCKNITEQKKLEEEIRKALNKERELNELKSRFVTTASHEFRTPLSTIMSSVSLIARYEGDQYQDQRKKHIQRIKTSVNNLTQILNDFLSIGKLEEGKEVFTPTYFDLVDLIGEVRSQLQPMLKNGQQIIHNNGTPKCQRIYQDKQMMRNILINLLSNAIKYSPEDKDVKVCCAHNEQLLTLKVIDQGIGIPKKDQLHIFERFFRAKNVMNIEGTGLGLNIVRKYVEMMQGEVNFHSSEEEGTEFIIKLPILEEK